MFIQTNASWYAVVNSGKLNQTIAPYTDALASKPFLPETKSYIFQGLFLVLEFSVFFLNLIFYSKILTYLFSET